MNKRKIVGIVTVYDGIDLLQHFALHYVRLGVDELHFVLCSPLKGQIQAMMLATYRPVVHFHEQQTHVKGEEVKMHIERRVLANIVTDEDWVLHLDLDEFQEYPARLPTIVELLESKHLPFVKGEFVDRLSSTGVLAPILPEPSIFSQFPIGSSITRSWLSLPSSKVMICRGWVELYYGRHVATNAEADALPLGLPSQYRVHHFKWFAGIRSRLTERATEWTGMDSRYQESNRRFAASIRENRIDPKRVPGYEWCGAYIYPES